MKPVKPDKMKVRKCYNCRHTISYVPNSQTGVYHWMHAELHSSTELDVENNQLYYFYKLDKKCFKCECNAPVYILQPEDE